MRQDFKRLSTYRHDLKVKNKAFLTDDDVSPYYIQESLPSNDMIFGAVEIANTLTTRTVQTYVNFSSPFSRLEHIDRNLASEAAFKEFTK